VESPGRQFGKAGQISPATASATPKAKQTFTGKPNVAPFDPPQSRTNNSDSVLDDDLKKF